VSFQLTTWYRYLLTQGACGRVVDRHRFDADLDPDPSFHFDADPDPDPTFHIDADPVPYPDLTKLT
jgi:hypothetical protein